MDIFMVVHSTNIVQYLNNIISHIANLAYLVTKHPNIIETTSNQQHYQN
jgi:hypothetical protein